MRRRTFFTSLLPWPAGGSLPLSVLAADPAKKGDRHRHPRSGTLPTW